MPRLFTWPQEVLAEIAAASMWFLVIPARVTWLLQPLDTHAFFRYKFFLTRKFAETAMDVPGLNKVKKMFQLVVEAMRYALQGHRWQLAFQQNGICRDQPLLSATILRTLSPTATDLSSEDGRPTVEHLRFCWLSYRRSSPQ